MSDITSHKKLQATVSGNSKKTLFWGVVVSIILTCLIFAVIEIKYPFYFSTDDNADWYASEYASVIRVILSGKFPMYSFSQFTGQRCFANGQSGVLNPVMYLAAALSYLVFRDLRATVECLALLMMILGSAGAFVLLKRLGAGPAIAVAGALAWNFNGYNVWVGASWILVILTTGVLPYIFYGSLRLCDKPSFCNYLWAIIPKVFLFYIGHPQFFFYAALYDCVFAGMYTLVKNKEDRIKRTLKLIGRYVLIYIAVIILVLPQLVPQFQMVNLTRHGGALSFEDFNNESNGVLIGMIWPYIYKAMWNEAIDPYIGYPLTIFLFVGFSLPLLPFTTERESVLKHKPLLLNILACVPCALLAGMSSYSLLFKHLLYRIPVINRFHFLHRNNIYLTAMLIIFTCLTCTFCCRLFKDMKGYGKKIGKKTSRILGVIFVLLEAFSLAFVFTSMPQWSRGQIYDVKEGYDTEYASKVSDMRYLCVGYDLYFSKEEKQNLSHSLRYNLSSYYGINNISGYYGVYTSVGLGENLNLFENIMDYSGDLTYPYPHMVGELRGLSVRWYVINPARRELFEKLMKVYGIEKVYEDEYGIIYRDDKCEPLAYDSEGRKVDLEQSEVNDLKLRTDDGFKGGTITLNYTYDKNFHCFIDGKETSITDDTGNLQMMIECPEGAHDILIRYIDNDFTACCIITGTFVVLSAAAYAVYRLKNKKKIAGGKTNG